MVSYAFAGVRNVPSKRKMRKFEQQFIQKKWPLSWVRVSISLEDSAYHEIFVAR